MVEQIIDLANNNQGLIAILIFILGIVGYLLKRFLFSDRSGNTSIQKQKGGNNSTNIQAGRDINVPK